MLSTLFIAAAMVGAVALFIAILMFVHKRDQKADAAKKANSADTLL